MINLFNLGLAIEIKTNLKTMNFFVNGEIWKLL